MVDTTRSALITGGAQGIGKATAAHLMREGYQVVIADCDAAAGREAVEELGGGLVFVQTDVSQEADVAAAVAQTVERFGRLDLLVNNAGVFATRPLARLTLAEWNRVIGTNLTGAFLCSREAAPHLARTRGAIVNIGSTRALMSEPDTEAYAASKGGLNALTHALAISLGPAIRVNGINPGWIDVSAWKKSTERKHPELSSEDHAQHPAGRVGRPEDVAAIISYLASDAAGFITGQNLVVDGGMTRKMIYAE